jgi:hypothetical protein
MDRHEGDRDRKWLGTLTSGIFLCKFALLFSPCTSATAAANDAVVIGVVEEFKGLSRDYRLNRGGPDLPLRICDQVQAGDRISKMPRNGSVKIRLTTDEIVEVAERQLNQPIEPRGMQPTFRSNLLASLASLLTPWHDSQAYNFAIRDIGDQPSASQPLQIPLIPPAGASVASGRRPFSVIWLGGTPPFKLSLTAAAAGPSIFESDRMMGRELPKKVLTLSIGAYTVRLSDAAGQEIERPLDVVPEEVIPLPPEEPAPTNVPSAWLVTARAGWLAQQGQGRWLLEAFLEATPMRSSFEPAGTLVSLLANGGLKASR